MTIAVRQKLLTRKDTDVLFERNRPATIERRGLYAQWLTELEIHERLIYIDDWTQPSHAKQKVAHLVGERVHSEACSRDQNMIVILAINQKMGLLHHQLGQFAATHDAFQDFANTLIVKTANFLSGENTIDIVYDLFIPSTSEYSDPRTTQWTLCFGHSASIQPVSKSDVTSPKLFQSRSEKQARETGSTIGAGGRRCTRSCRSSAATMEGQQLVANSSRLSSTCYEGKVCSMVQASLLAHSNGHRKTANCWLILFCHEINNFE